MPAEAVAASKQAAADKQKGFDAESTILVENIKREIKFHRLVSEYSITPSAKKNFILSQKPNTTSVSVDEPEDDDFRKLFDRLAKAPKEKLEYPLTTSQEYGWNTELLVKPVMDRRFHHPKVTSDVTKLYGFTAGAKVGGGEKKGGKAAA